MSDEEFVAFMGLMMCSDPWPMDHEPGSFEILEGFADQEAQKRGFMNWIVALHEFKVS